MITVILVCPNCDYEIDLDKHQDRFKKVIVCPACKLPVLYGRMLKK